MFLTKRKKNVIIFLAASLVVLNLLLVSLVISFKMLPSVYDAQDAEVIAERNQRNIEQEFRELAPLSQAAVIRHGSMRKVQHGIVSTGYKTGENYESIKLHYHQELISRGWNFSKEDSVLYEGIDYGGKELLYCKSGYAARLQYAGQQEIDFGWTFSFGITWGLADECK